VDLISSPRARRGLLGALAALALAFGAVLAGAVPAKADASLPWTHDRAHHTWCYQSGFTLSTEADWAMTWLRTQTDANTAFWSPCAAEVDVWWSNFYQPGTFGQTACKAVTSSAPGVCTEFYVRMNATLINAQTLASEQRKKTSCHELGHTVGVNHYGGVTGLPNPDGVGAADSCMKSGTVTTAGAWTSKWGPHHINVHINPTFP